LLRRRHIDIIGIGLLMSGVNEFGETGHCVDGCRLKLRAEGFDQRECEG
jgi:hypothetical protein